MATEAWTVVWKKNHTGIFMDCAMTFGFSESCEEAMRKVAHVLRHGRSNPPTTAHEFRRQFADGIFLPLAIHGAIPVESDGSTQLFPELSPAIPGMVLS